MNFYLFAASARLSKILMDRNMTLNELVEHRERGSSHVHLADIFHNASKEPNPPEPFLSKSSIEPISKETYPLRALLDANHHDPLTRVTTLEPNPSQTQYIPVVLNFGNNVNENGENMGIMSLFNKLASDANTENSTLNEDSQGTPYVSTVTSDDTTLKDETTRESRVLTSDNDNLSQDVVAWKTLYELMRKNNKTTSSSNPELPQAAEGNKYSDYLYSKYIKPTFIKVNLKLYENLQNCIDGYYAKLYKNRIHKHLQSYTELDDWIAS